jgi:Domain of unknown function (DUF4292)
MEAKTKISLLRSLRKNILTIRINSLSLIGILFLFTNQVNGQDKLHFFSAKADISIDKNDEKQDFTGHIRFNTRDTLWISFTGSFGIEGARMLVTNDSTFVINKLEKTAMAYSNDQSNDLIPYSFSMYDWRMLLLNIPYPIDSFSTQDPDSSWVKLSSDSKVKYKLKSNLVHTCQLQQFSTNMSCNVDFSQFVKQEKMQIANHRILNISNGGENSFKIVIRYVDFKLNSIEPFVFNFAKYSHVEH